ncbi:MoaD/ThiS family protein [Microbacterium suwonense]|uniref:Molybdenum cofactor biosynthesis protein D2 / thiamineS n=1 Tax=Microbacterium suwonense TaxID=683047 RepID=A0ABM8FNZ8_9MICO|nr:MoaD/ThiS family protein [Microbacterium suwonense]BDZ37446.1 putative molybdenum cofactor biosynthesis protein D2 / thiamineS [Microbacterium suwonense]
MAQVRFFAAAEEAVGSPQLTVDATTLQALTASLSDEHPALAEILPRCSVLVDGVRVDGSWPLPGDAVVDVLPPFAGG